MRQSSLEPIAPKEGQIDVWRFSLECDSSLVSGFFQTLSSDEKQKADRFRFKSDRDHYVVARGKLRRIMGGYSGIELDRVRFAYNKYGKPFLDNGNRELGFNLSHSRDTALVAVTFGSAVGIDIEFVDDDVDVLATAKRVFSQTETSMLEKLKPEVRTKAFFRAWTRKEAYLKAIGMGFAFREAYSATSELTGQSASEFRPNEFQEGRRWSVMSLPTDSNYVAAVATEGVIGTIRNYRFFNN